MGHFRALIEEVLGDKIEQSWWEKQIYKMNVIQAIYSKWQNWEQIDYDASIAQSTWMFGAFVFEEVPRPELTYVCMYSEE